MTHYENWSTAALVERYLKEVDDDKSWRILGVLHSRGTETELSVAIDLCASEDSDQREFGADILAQLGGGDCRFARESEDVLLRLLHDGSMGVLIAAIHAVGLLRIASAIKSLVNLSKHERAEIREAVAYALGLVGEGSVIATSALVALSGDADIEVRDWAVFGLAVQLKADSETIVTALFNSLTDEDSLIRSEALLGLTRRGQPGLTSKVRNEIEAGNVNEYIMEAAEQLAHPSLCQCLVAAAAPPGDSETREYLTRAIIACCNETGANASDKVKKNGKSHVESAE